MCTTLVANQAHTIRHLICTPNHTDDITSLALGFSCDVHAIHYGPLDAWSVHPTSTYEIHIAYMLHTWRCNRCICGRIIQLITYAHATKDLVSLKTRGLNLLRVTYSTAFNVMVQIQCRELVLVYYTIAISAEFEGVS